MGGARRAGRAIGGAICLAIAPAALAVPLEMTHQGRLLDDGGTPLTGTHTLTFSLYTDTGAVVPVWSEAIATDFDAGYYRVVLGTSPGNELSDAVLDGGTLYLGVAVDGGTELPARQPVVSVPYAVRAATATNLSGGVVDASEVIVGGDTVIDTDGTLVNDADTLADLPCVGGQLAVFDGAQWTCGEFPDGPVVSWADLADLPAGFDDDVDDDTLGALSCGDGQVAKWSSGLGRWECEDDDVLSEVQVESFVTNGPLDLNVFTTLNGASISTGPHTVDTVLEEWEVEDYVTNDAIDLAPGTTLDGAEISVGPHTASPSGQVSFFNLDTCPEGWSELTIAGGRTLVGLPPGGTRGATVGTALLDLQTRTITDVPAHVHTVDPPLTASTTDGSHGHPIDPPSTSSSTSGSHTHPYDDIFWSEIGGYVSLAAAGSFGSDEGYDNDNLGYQIARTTASAGDHSHTVDVGPFDSALSGSHTHTVDIGSFSSASAGLGSVDVTMPYVQLLVCEKD